MLTINVPESDLWNEKTNEFIHIKACTINLEHSLVSISKWESKWCKPFLSKTPKSTEEVIDYIRCMTLTQNVDCNVYFGLGQKNMDIIDKYINSTMTATSITEKKHSRGGNEIITSELIYYWMTVLNIPVEFQKWHLNRLLMLIRVCSAKSKPPEKYSQREIMASNAALNAKRRKALNSSG